MVLSCDTLSVMSYEYESDDKRFSVMKMALIMQEGAVEFKMLYL